MKTEALEKKRSKESLKKKENEEDNDNYED
jgi:hypothetical protein